MSQQTERQADRETGRQRDRQTERQADRERDRQTERQRNRQTERQSERFVKDPTCERDITGSVGEEWPTVGVVCSLLCPDKDGKLLAKSVIYSICLMHFLKKSTVQLLTTLTPTTLSSSTMNHGR
jgi:hypothetical protein